MLSRTPRLLKPASLNQRNVHVSLSNIDRAYPLIDC
jgi:hypothetical protein